MVISLRNRPSMPAEAVLQKCNQVAQPDPGRQRSARWHHYQKSITVDNRRFTAQLMSKEGYRLGVPKTQITIRIYKLVEHDLFFFAQSHFLHTPKQLDPYMTNANYANTYEWTLRRARDTFGDYTYAVRAGHKPEESWLVKNRDFR